MNVKTRRTPNKIKLTPRSLTINDYEIETDGITVWVNASDGSSVARFGKAGIDIHTSMTAQMAGAKECLFCTHTWTTLADWHIFVARILEHYQLVIPTNFIPARFK